MAETLGVYIIFEIGIILCISSLAAEGFKRLRLPGLIGAILVGLFIGGPGGIGWVTDLNVINIFAMLGAIFILFSSGLELDSTAFVNAEKKAFLLTTLGVIASVVLGTVLGLCFGWTSQAAFLLGVMISPSGTSIIATILNAKQKIDTGEGSALLTAAVVDDIEGVLLLSIALGGWGQGSNSIVNIILITVFAIIFIFGSIYLGRHLLPKLMEKLQRKISEDGLFAILIGVGLMVAFCASLVGLSPITGAFIVGVLIPYKKFGEKMDSRISMMKELFAILFFTSIGLSINPLNMLALLPVSLLVLGVALAMRLLGGLAGGRLDGYSGKSLWAMASGLAIRGEVTLIIAQTAISIGIVGPEFLTIGTVVVIGSILILLPFYNKMSQFLH